MGRKLLDVDERQSLGSEDRADRVQREVREVLVVDRVVLEVLEQGGEVGEFERRRPVGGEKRSDAAGEVVDVGHLREDVVAKHEVGSAALGR